MPSTTATNGSSINHVEELDNNDKPARRGNPLMRTLTPDMIREPYELEFADGMMSHEFAYEKTSKHIVEALDFKSEKEWMDYAKAVWKWKQDYFKRQATIIAQKILAEASENPTVLEILKQKLNG